MYNFFVQNQQSSLLSASGVFSQKADVHFVEI